MHEAAYGIQFKKPSLAYSKQDPSSDLSSVMSSSVKYDTTDSRRFRPVPVSYSNTLELFPDPDVSVI